MKKILLFLALIISLFSIKFVFPNISLAAPKLFFDPSSQNVSGGNNFDAVVKINTDSSSVFGSEVIVNYPSNFLEIRSINNGGFFPDFNSSYDSTKILIRAYSSSPFDYKTGSGIIATISFTAKAGFQETSLNFACSGSSIIDNNGQNILSCSDLNSLILTLTGTGGPDPTNGPTYQPGTSNTCGGTCGSDSNCQSGYFCYSGFCRNPSCPTDTDCDCIIATKKPVATYKPKVTASPQTIVLEDYIEPMIFKEEPTPFPEELLTEKSSWKKFIPYLLILLLIIIIILLLKNRKKKSGDQEPPISQNFIPVEPVIKPTDNFQPQNPISSNTVQTQEPQVQNPLNQPNNPLPQKDNPNSNI